MPHLRHNDELYMMDEFTVFRLSEYDIEVAQQLASELLGEASVASERLMELLKDDRSIVLAAIHNNDPVAYLVTYCFPSLSGERLAYLYDIEVKQTFRRRGVARLLVEHLLATCQAKGVESIWVGSSHANAPAIALWTSTGAERDSDQYIEFWYDLDDT